MGSGSVGDRYPCSIIELCILSRRRLNIITSPVALFKVLSVGVNFRRGDCFCLFAGVEFPQVSFKLNKLHAHRVVVACNQLQVIY